MAKIDLSNYSESELLHLYGGILDELNARGIVRTYNSPVGDYAEWLTADRLNLTLEHNSQKGYDAVDNVGKRYQIKSRWIKSEEGSKSRKLNVIRNLEDNQFDQLIVVLFDREFGVKEAYVLSHDLVKKWAKYNEHQNGHILTMYGDILSDPDIINITSMLK